MEDLGKAKTPEQKIAVHSVRNLIISSFLKGFKKSSPFCFWPNSQYYNLFEPQIRAILDSNKTTIFVLYESGVATPYKGPFKLEIPTSRWSRGWLIIQEPNIIVSFNVFPNMRMMGYARRMLIRGFEELDRPRVMKLKYPTSDLYACARKSLREECVVRVYAQYENPYN